MLLLAVLLIASISLGMLIGAVIRAADDYELDLRERVWELPIEPPQDITNRDGSVEARRVDHGGVNA